MIASVCGGIAETINADPTVVRLIAVFLCFLSGVVPLVIAYLIAWVIIPKR
jgi:phage shock protein C